MQLSALSRGTRLVTLTVGAADLDLSDVLTACTADPPSRQSATAITGGHAYSWWAREQSHQSVHRGGDRGAQCAHRGHWLSAPVRYLPDCGPPADINDANQLAMALLNATIQQAVAGARPPVSTSSTSM